MFCHDERRNMITKRTRVSPQHFIVVLCFLIVPVISEKCEYLNPCKCQFKNGSVIDLSSIASQDGAKWKHVKPESPKDPKDVYFYYYNPCYNFKLGNEACKDGVAVCQVDDKETMYQNCGDQEHADFLWDDKKSAFVLSYKTLVRATNVTLICDHNADTPKLEVFGEEEKLLNNYEMALTSKCACPNGCIESGLSFGSGLLIIFFISVLLYLFLGVVYNHLVRGAHGLELIPNYEFWKDFPLLVKDGCIFVSSGCRRETSYERI